MKGRSFFSRRGQDSNCSSSLVIRSCFNQPGSRLTVLRLRRLTRRSRGTYETQTLRSCLSAGLPLGDVCPRLALLFLPLHSRIDQGSRVSLNRTRASASSPSCQLSYVSDALSVVTDSVFERWTRHTSCHLQRGMLTRQCDCSFPRISLSARPSSICPSAPT